MHTSAMNWAHLATFGGVNKSEVPNEGRSVESF